MSPLAAILLKLSAVAGPLLALAWVFRVYPDRRLVLLVLAPWLLSVGLLGSSWLQC